MSKLVVVSNRLPPIPSPKDTASRRQEIGGLVSALLSALDMTGGGIWFGWSGKTGSASHAPPVTWEVGKNRIIGFDLTEREVDSYYNGFSNRCLWPLFHSYQGRINIKRSEVKTYAHVNTKFARVLQPLIQKNDSVWVNDYHLLLMGRELRRLGHAGPLGFFLHVPFPPYDIWSLMPNPAEILDAMMEFNLVGFHTRTYLDNYVYSAQRILNASFNGKTLALGVRRQRVGIFPIGVDNEKFAEQAQSAHRNRRRRGLKSVENDRKIILGVDRLDYTKGIPNRIQAFETLLRNYPQTRGNVSFFQICAPSRTRVPEYIEQKRTVENLVGRINGEFSEHDWVPISYMYRSYPQERLSLFYREADVCLVTPLRDGMNLVAKEFIAAQDPADPGVLVLSRFTGASEELREAILVNPYALEEVADGIYEGLYMPMEEKIARNKVLGQIVSHQNVNRWLKTYLSTLGESKK